MNTIGRNIAFYRKEKGITQEQLAEICHVSPQAVSKWENDISCPDITLLKPISRVFGVSVDKLLDDGTTPAAFLAENTTAKGNLLKIRILDKSDKININLPIALIELLLKRGNIFDAIKLQDKENALKFIDFQGILDMVSLGVFGKILEMESENGELVEIWVE